MIIQQIASSVQYFRKQSSLSQQQLATLAGVGKTAIFDIEKGKATVKLATLLKVLETLNIHLKLETPFKQPESDR